MSIKTSTKGYEQKPLLGHVAVWDSCEVQGSLCGFEEPNTVNKQMEKNKDLQNLMFQNRGRMGDNLYLHQKLLNLRRINTKKDHSWTLKQFLAGNRDGDSGGQQMKVQQ